MTLLKDVMKRVNDVIQTDEFSPYALGPKNAHPEWREAYEAMHKMSDKSEKLKAAAESI